MTLDQKMNLIRSILKEDVKEVQTKRTRAQERNDNLLEWQIYKSKNFANKKIC